MRDDASQFVGSIPGCYDAGLGPRLFEPFAHDMARRVAELAPASVLELAAGTGIVSRLLRDAMPDDARLTVSDLNEPMLAIARNRFQPEEAVEFTVADAMALPFAEGSFAAIVCQFGAMFFPDKPASFREARRILSDGGSYLFSCWLGWEDNAFARLTHETVAGFLPDDPPAFYRVPFSYYDEDAIRADLSGAGFGQIATDTVRIEQMIGSHEEFARGLIFGNPIVAEIATRGGDAEAISAELADRLADELGGSLSLAALVVRARTD